MKIVREQYIPFIAPSSPLRGRPESRPAKWFSLGREQAPSSDHTDHAASQLHRGSPCEPIPKVCQLFSPSCVSPRHQDATISPIPSSFRSAQWSSSTALRCCTHDRATHDALIQVANDYLWYGQYLEKLTGAAPPWDATASQRRDTPIAIPGDRGLGRVHAVDSQAFTWWGSPSLPSLMSPRRCRQGSLSSHTSHGSRRLPAVELVQRPDKRWQVLHAEVKQARRRQGIATMLYDRIETLLDTQAQALGLAVRRCLPVLAEAQPQSSCKGTASTLTCQVCGSAQRQLLNLFSRCPSEVDAGDAEGGLPN